MVENQACSECGAELDAYALRQGLCPKCLLELGLEETATDQLSTLASEEQTEPASRPVRTRLSSGQRFGHYQILRLLGKGGMGEVYEAEDLDSGRVVALKVLSQRLDSPKDKQRFLREGRLASSVSFFL